MAAEKKQQRDYSSQSRHHTWPKTCHHSEESLPAGDASHSTDQPGGKVQGQGELATESSNDIPENHIISKADYTNT
jgi:hypothetical protein